MSQTLDQIYSSFKANPKDSFLSPNSPCLSYITSGITFDNAQSILQHLANEAFEISKSTKQIISSHVTQSSLVLETDAEIKFLRGPGAFLPGLSTNFVADEQVSLLLIEIVEFDENNLIRAIRYIWDQATLLKQLKVIGARGNVWPIYDANDQIALAKRQGASKTNLPGNRASPEKHQAPMRSMPVPVNIFDNSPMDPIPVAVSAIEPPSPSAKPQQRTFQDIMNMTNSPRPTPPDLFANPQRYLSERPIRTSTMRARPQSAYVSLFGSEEDDNSQGLSKRSLKSHWPSWTTEEEKENSSR